MASKGTFYNTIAEPPQDLQTSRRAVDKQENIILSWFKGHPHSRCTPFEIHDQVLPAAPITSVRRALTNLTDSGLLEKLDSQKVERWGKRNYEWRLAERPAVQMEMF